MNQAIARVLDGMRRRWRVSGERTQVLKAAGQRPDIVVRQEGRPPVLIENEFTPAAGVEDEARNRLGKELQDGGKARIVVAMRSPDCLRKADNRKLDRLTADAEFEYALFSGAENPVRFPKFGWLSGKLTDLAGFVYRASVPADAVQAAAISLEKGVQQAAKILEANNEEHPDFGVKIGKILQQEYGEQTQRMAMTILVNALAFHDNVAGREGILSLGDLRKTDPMQKIRQMRLCQEWRKILDVDYWPIFWVALEILSIFNARLAQRILDELVQTAEVLFAEDTLISHDLFGGVFQRLISDRKFLATFYTRPASAALLANLAIPENAPFENGNWKDNAKNYVIADFACGTGALLTAAYQRVSELHERAGGNASKIHPEMMENSLVACDVMPAAVHLTASVLSCVHPNQAFDNTRIYTMPYGEPKKGEFRIGSLELLEEQSFLPVISTSAKHERGKGRGKAELRGIPWRSTNLVIMNPPFTRSTKHEGDFKDVPNPAWAGLKTTPALQANLGNRAKKLRADTCGSGNAGLASDFTALADKMVCRGGTIALVLPLSLAAGESWRGVREMWTRNYKDIRVVTIASPRIEDCAFSADTGMGEMLFIGTKQNGREHNASTHKNPRGIFVILKKRAETEIESAEIARIIRQTLRGKIRKLEDGPYGGTALRAGQTIIGEMLDAPLPIRLSEETDIDDPWEVVRIRDLSLAQTAHALVNGRLWFAGKSKNVVDIPICNLGQFARRGFLDRDINGIEHGKPRGPFDKHSPCSKTATYPCLWGHDAQRERTMLVEPDSECTVRIGMEKRAAVVWETASRTHFSGGFRFNSQPLAVAMTEKPTIGGPAWQNVILWEAKREEAFALWGNSTLGLMLYWWRANKQHDGRGQISPIRVLGMPTLNVSTLDAKQLATARRGFNALKNRPLLPFYRATEDETRAELDRVILCEVLGLPKKVLESVALVREKLCAEPSILGGKQIEE